MENPLLSIIIPVYNVAPYLRACIDSVLGQAFASFELILIDDGSTDESGAICEEYALRDNRIRVIRQANRGLSGARNAGLETARGEYVAFVDSDDTVSSDLFAENMQILRQHPSVDLLEFPIFIYYGAPEQHLWRKGPHDFGKTPFEEWFRQKGYNHLYACNKIYKRILFEGIRFPEGKLFEDIYTIPYLVKRCRHYYLSDRGIYYYHAREGSISRKRSFEQYLALFDSNYRLWKEVAPMRELSVDTRVFALGLADWLVAMGRTDMKRTYRLMDSYPLPALSVKQLLALPVPITRKLKNLPLVLLGRHIHCMIYSLIK